MHVKCTYMSHEEPISALIPLNVTPMTYSYDTPRSSTHYAKYYDISTNIYHNFTQVCRHIIIMINFNK